MEKYRSTSDPTTGLHPFLPPPPAPFSILSPFLILLRLPLLLVLFPIHFLSLHLPSFIARPIVSLISAILLFTLSAFPNQPKPLHQNLQPPPTPPSAPCLILCNLHSPLIPLHLFFSFSPSFLLPTSSGLLNLSPSTLIYFLLSGRFSSPPTAPLISDLPALLRSSRAPVVLFPEGLVSNGKGILAFSPHARAPISTVIAHKIPVFALGYSSHPSLAYWGIGSALIYLLRLLGTTKSSLQPRYVQLKLADLRNPQLVLARSAQLPALSVGIEKRIQFEEHWRHNRPPS